jgi:hypothetical protein
MCLYFIKFCANSINLFKILTITLFLPLALSFYLISWQALCSVIHNGISPSLILSTLTFYRYSDKNNFCLTDLRHVCIIMTRMVTLTREMGAVQSHVIWKLQIRLMCQMQFIILVNKTNRCIEFQFYWYYDSTCFGQPFCPSSGVLSRCTESVTMHGHTIIKCSLLCWSNWYG